MKFNDWKVSAQLVAIMLTMGLIVAFAVGAFSIWRASTALSNQYKMHLESMRESRAADIQQYFNQAALDVEAQADRTIVKDTLAKLKVFGKNVAATDPFPINAPGYKEIWDSASSIWDTVKGLAYYDVFIIDIVNGQVMYTGCKEPDLGANLSAGPQKDGPLADMWRQVKEHGDTRLVDMTAYAPSKGVPAMFIGTPIKVGGQVVGVMAMQLPLDKLDAVLGNDVGMGDKGETLLLGSDKIARCNGRLKKKKGEDTVLKLTENSEGVSRALEGKTGFVATLNYDKVPVLCSYMPVSLLTDQVKWVGVTQINRSEAYAPIYVLIKWIIGIVIVLTVVVIIAALFTGRRIGNPLARLASAAGTMSGGDFTVALAHSSNKDEIGHLNESFIEMQEKTRHLIQQVAAAATNVASSSEELSAGADETGKAIQQVAQTVQEVARGSQETTQNINAAQQNITQSAKAIEGVSRDIEDVAAYATQAAAQGNEGKKSADEAVVIIDHAAISVQKTSQVVVALGEKTK